MTLKEIGRFEYNGYTFIILEEKTKDYLGKPFFEYYYSFDKCADIKYLFGAADRFSADSVWNYMGEFIEEIIEDFSEF